MGGVTFWSLVFEYDGFTGELQSKKSYCLFQDEVFVGLIPWIAIISWIIKLEIDKVKVSTSVNSYNTRISWVSIYCYTLRHIV